MVYFFFMFFFFFFFIFFFFQAEDVIRFRDVTGVQTCALPISDELLTFNCLRLSTNETFNQWRFGAGAQQQLLRIEGNFITDNVETLYQYALAGQGIVRLAGFMVAEAVADGRLKLLLQRFQTDQQQVHAVYPHRKFLPAKVQVFIEFLQQHFRRVDWG